MTDTRLHQHATEAVAQSDAPNRAISQQGVESITRAGAMARGLAQQGIESITRAGAMARGLAQQGVEAAALPVPESATAQILSEIVVYPDQDRLLHAGILEILWREPPTPGLFAFAHDWSDPWREELAWRTNVLESVDGGESRIKLRSRPLRVIGLSVLAGDVNSVNLDAWLHAHQGRAAHLPIWLVMRRVSADAAAGATSLHLSGLDARFARTLQTRSTGVTGSGPMLILDADGDAQLAFVDACDTLAGTLDLRDPLARPVQAGARCAPLVEARLIDVARLDRHAASVSAVKLMFDADPPLYVHSAPALPTLDGLAVLDPRNWATEHDITYSARVDTLDNGIAQAWVSRRNDRPARVLSWSLLARGADGIEAAMGLTDYLAGRWKECWVPDELTGIDLAQAAASGDSTLIVGRGAHPSILEEGGRGLLLRAPGHAPAALRMSGLASLDEDIAALNLATPLPHDAPAGSRLCGLRRARLDHDLVELIWHTDDLLELTLRFAELPPRGARMSGSIVLG